jgi:hypothetical protein
MNKRDIPNRTGEFGRHLQSFIRLIFGIAFFLFRYIRQNENQLFVRTSGDLSLFRRRISTVNLVASFQRRDVPEFHSRLTWNRRSHWFKGCSSQTPTSTFETHHAVDLDNVFQVSARPTPMLVSTLTLITEFCITIRAEFAVQLVAVRPCVWVIGVFLHCFDPIQMRFVEGLGFPFFCHYHVYACCI